MVSGFMESMAMIEQSLWLKGHRLTLDSWITRAGSLLGRVRMRLKALGFQRIISSVPLSQAKYVGPGRLGRDRFSSGSEFRARLG